MAESTTPLPNSKLSINMQTFHCDSLELRLQFPSGEMDVGAFVRVVTERGIKADPDKDGDIDVTLVFGHPDSEVNYHAHLRVLVRADESGRIDLSFHLGPSGDKDEQPPYVENCAKWLGSFLKSEKLPMHVHANYTFDKTFVPAVTLPFPFTTPVKALRGAVVTGLGLLLPNEAGSTATKTVIIQSSGEETFIFLRVDDEMSLKDFDLFLELETLSATVNTLIKKEEVAN